MVHFYYVGAKEKNRNPVIEALLTNYATTGEKNRFIYNNNQLSLSDFANVNLI